MGAYEVGISGAVTENSQNFSNTVTVLGAHQVTTKGLVASSSGVTKVYDGSVSMSNVLLGLSAVESGDLVTVDGQGAFSGKNAGTGLSYTIANVTLSGADAANYHLTAGSSFTGNDGVITPKIVSLSASKVYDGSTNLSDAVTIATGVGLETLS